MSLGGCKIQVAYDGIDITQMIERVEWSGHVENIHRQLSVSLINTASGRSHLVDFEEGKAVVFRNFGKTLFVGVLFAQDINERGMQTLTAYDENVYLYKSIDTRKFNSVKASDIVRRLAKDFGIPTGTISDTGYVIPRLILKEKSLKDTIDGALTMTREQTGRRFFVGNEAGKLTLKAVKDIDKSYVIESSKNILTASYSRSIEETKTQVKVIGGKDGAFTATKKDATLVKKYGTMQEVERMDEKATKSQVEQRANELLRELAVINDVANITALGIDDIISGKGVYVREPMTGIIGGYYVANDSHTFTPTGHTMALEMSATLELPKIEFTEEELGREQT